VCNEKKDILEWRNTNCIPECTLGVCRLHTREFIEKIEKSVNELGCSVCEMPFDANHINNLRP